MAGGYWTSQNKNLPGVYINFRSRPSSMYTIGDRGVAAIAEAMPWGEEETLVEINSVSEILAKTGYPITDPSNKFLRQILTGSDRSTGAQKVLLYRLKKTGAVKAAVNVKALNEEEIPEEATAFVATAKYPGTGGNSIVVKVIPDFSTEAETTSRAHYAVNTVETYFNGVLVDSQTVGSYTDDQTYTRGHPSDLTDTEWVTFNSTGYLNEFPDKVETAILAGGTNGTVSNGAYDNARTALETVPFDVYIYDGTNADVKAAFKIWVERLASDYGRYAQLVCGEFTTADSEFVISVMNGYTDLTGTYIPANEAARWVGGATAGANYWQSLTYAHNTDANSIPQSDKKTVAEQEQIVAAGGLVFDEDTDGYVKIVKDIDTFVSFAPEKGKAFSKNRVIRVLQTIAESVKYTFETSYVGKVNNDAMGRSLLNGEIVGMMTEMQGRGGIQNFVPTDVEVLPGNEADSVVINLSVQPTDAVEKIYMTVVVS